MHITCVEYLAGLNGRVSVEDRRQWMMDLAEAQRTRLVTPASMDMLSSHAAAVDMPAGLAQMEVDEPQTASGHIWLATLVTMEEKQLHIRELVRLVRPETPQEERDKITELREELEEELQMTLSTIPASLRPSTTQGPADDGPEDAFDDIDPTDTPQVTQDIGVDEDESAGPAAEMVSLWLPSSSDDPLASPWCTQGVEVRKEQANRHLDAMRQLIAEKSVIFLHVVRISKQADIQTRSKRKVWEINARIGWHAKVYRRARAALVSLEDEDLDTYRVLEKEDLKASTAMLDPNTPGASDVRLSWIWHVGEPSPDSSDPAIVRECKCRPRLHTTALI